MGILRIDVAGAVPAERDLDRIDRAARALPPGAPVTFLVHGFRYLPGHPFHDPHAHIFSQEPGGGGRSLSWVRHLGHRGTNPPPGLVVAFGWNGRGTIWAAHARARPAGHALGRLIQTVRSASPGRRINAIGHSLGARVILSALPALGPGDLERAVLLSAAVFRDEARAGMESPAGRATEVINVTSRENDLFDFCMEAVVGGGLRASVGHGLGQSVRNWVDVQLDKPSVQRGLAALGFPVHDRSRRICHWSTFRRPGVFALYRALLTDPVPLPFSLLADCLPEGQSARWSRLLAPPSRIMALPPRGERTT